MRRSVARIVPVAMLATLAMVLPGVLGAAAHAGDGSLHVTGAPLDAARLAPGSGFSGTLEVRNDSAYVTRLDLRAIHVAQAENSCEAPERRVPSERCDADGGELGHWLEIRVSRDESPHQLLWAGSMRQLEAGATLSDAMPAGAVWRLRMTLDLPFAATNDTMTDSIDFGLRLDASSQDGVTEVSGPQVQAGGPGDTGVAGSPGENGVLAPLTHGPRVGLPMTGATVSLWMLLLDLALLLVGGVLLTLVRRPADGLGAPQRHTTWSQ